MQQLAEIGAHAQQLFDRNRKLLNEFLDTRDDLEVVRPEFGTVMFPRVRDGSSETAVSIVT
jgi:aspartate/methionine/tyrosine aminotransferase